MNKFEKVILEYSREHEDMVLRMIKNAKPKYSREISELIVKALQTQHKVYLCTDWHLWRYDKSTRRIVQRSDFKTIISNYNKIVKDGDVVINLGDLVGGECENKRALASVIQMLRGIKVLVRGNNDLFSDAYYINAGFKYVTPKFIFNDILFTHMPTENNNRLNIHGHIHGYRTYWIPYRNQIDVAVLDGRKKPVLLQKVIAAQPAYAKTVKVDTSKQE